MVTLAGDTGCEIQRNKAFAFAWSGAGHHDQVGVALFNDVGQRRVAQHLTLNNAELFGNSAASLAPVNHSGTLQGFDIDDPRLVLDNRRCRKRGLKGSCS